ncbi:MAG: phosphomannomutase/phosphoglucomutase [Gammaproteobacteria bacterium]|nr:phosphomannomutase/phosphoglucomutase [Gammaproteobacteria bacterium]
MKPAVPPRHIFRAYDIRGVVGESLTEEGVRRIGHAIGSEARERGIEQIALGRDGRLTGKTLAAELRAGLLAAGIDVLDLGEVATPLLYFAAITRCAGSGVMLTGSHNPPQYNGIKIMLGGETLVGEAVASLHQRLVQGDLHQGEGRVVEENVFPAYLDRVKRDVSIQPGYKVVVDGGNGVAGPFASALLKELGCEVIELYCEVDGRFPHHHPDPNRPENLRDLMKVVRERDANLGIALDGDGDRTGVVDEVGQIIWPDRVMMYLSRELLKSNPGATVIYDVKCSRALEDVIADAGGRPLMWKSGHSYAKAKLKETGAILAGELSGHIFFNDHWYGFDDGLYTAARLIELLSNELLKASKVFAKLPDLLSTPELHVEMAEGEPERLIETLREAIPFRDYRLFDVDGLRLEFPEGWVLVRASNTTPTLVIRFEALNAGSLANIQLKVRHWITAAAPQLNLPF